MPLPLKFLSDKEEQDILYMVRVIQYESQQKEKHCLVGDLNVTCGHCRTCGDIGSRCQGCGRVL
jgi:hypothetical protein